MSVECSTVAVGDRSTELSTVADDRRPERWLTIAEGCAAAGAGGCGLCGADVVVEGAADAGDVGVDELMVLPFPSCALALGTWGLSACHRPNRTCGSVARRLGGDVRLAGGAVLPGLRRAFSFGDVAMVFSGWPAGSWCARGCSS